MSPHGDDVLAPNKEFLNYSLHFGERGHLCDSVEHFIGDGYLSVQFCYLVKSLGLADYDRLTSNVKVYEGDS